MVEQMQQLMAQYLADTPARREKLYGLALLRTIHDPKIVARTLGKGKDKYGFIQAFRPLYQDYAFIFTDETHESLRVDVRNFLRQFLLKQRHKQDIHKLITRIHENQQQRLLALEQMQTYPDLRSRLCNEGWVEAFLDVLEAQFWADPSLAITHAIFFLLAASLYQPHLMHEIVDMCVFFISEIEASLRERWSEICRGFNLDDSAPQPFAKLAAIDSLKTRMTRGNLLVPPIFAAYSQQFLAALWWQEGELYRELNLQREALNHYLTALPALYSEAQIPMYTAQLFAVLAEKAPASDPQTRIEFLTKAVEYQPDFVDAYVILGNLYFDQTRYNQARTCYQYAIELHPHDFDCWTNLGVVHIHLKEYQRALDELNYAEQLNTTCAKLYFLRGNVHRELKAYAEAIADFSHAIQLDTDYADAYTNRGNMYAMLNQPEQASQDYEQTIRLQPDDMQALWLREWIHFGKQRVERMEVVAQRLLDIAAHEPDHYLAAVCTGIAQGFTQKQIKQALPELEQGCRKAPDQWDAYFWLGMLAAYCNHFRPAEVALDNAVELGLPAALLLPLYWLEKDRPDFFQRYAQPLLQKYAL